jgi:hypothetical protein
MVAASLLAEIGVVDTGPLHAAAHALTCIVRATAGEF